MSTAQAIILGAIIIAAAVFIGNIVRPAEAQHYGGGPYQLMHHSNTSGNAGVFRMDTSSGDVSYCYVASADGSNIICSRPVH